MIRPFVLPDSTSLPFLQGGVMACQTKSSGCNQTRLKALSKKPTVSGRENNAASPGLAHGG
jgi:hypothetical protein